MCLTHINMILIRGTGLCPAVTAPQHRFHELKMVLVKYSSRALSVILLEYINHIKYEYIKLEYLIAGFILGGGYHTPKHPHWQHPL